MLQLVLTLLIFFLLAIPLGRYVYHIADNKKTFADPVFDKVDELIYRISRVDKSEMGWKQYTAALLATNAVMLFTGYLILRVQSIPLFNPNSIGDMEPSLAFNTIVSFMTNTNLQHYSGESGLSYFSQMAVITMMMFTSSATGFSACAALARGITKRKASGQGTVGNFYVDLTRITTRALLPLSIIVTLLLVWQGSPQTLQPNLTIPTLEGQVRAAEGQDGLNQDIPLGPIASLVSIKHLGTNGGGFLGANSSTPLENPTILTNLIELYSMMAFPASCVFMFGLMHHYRDEDKGAPK